MIFSDMTVHIMDNITMNDTKKSIKKTDRPMYADIREIRMERSLQWPENSFQNREQQWLTLGHFSWACIRNLSTKYSEGAKVKLSDLRSNTDTPKRWKRHRGYSQSTYLLWEFPEGMQPKIDAFWEKKTPFMILTRANSSIGQTNFEKKIQSILGAFQTSCTNDSITSFDFVLYRTLDLADNVVITKSNSLSALLNAIDQLYCAKDIEDIYSYCCIYPTALSSSAPGQTVPGIEDVPENDQIAMLSLRFAVKDASACDSMLRSLTTFWKTDQNIRSDRTIRPALITGTEDINIIFNDIYTQDICRLFHHLLLTPIRSTLLAAVEDMTSRVGISEKPDVADGTHENIQAIAFHHDFERPGDMVYDYYKTIIDQLENSINQCDWQEDWVKILLENLYSLKSMSNNSVLRQLCYIFARPMKCAVNKIIQRCKRTAEQRIEWDDDDLNEFLSGVVYLMEHLIRMEGALVHHPETRPLVFDIPASILEFELSFATHCAKYLRDRECMEQDHDDKAYNFLLVPKLCKAITIHDRFNNRDDKDRLLYVEIPLSLIYKPFEVSCNIAHEVAHHSGEVTRMRPYRNKAFYSCAAIILADALYMGDDSSIHTEIYKYLVKFAKDHDGILVDAPSLLRDTYAYLCGASRAFLQDTRQIKLCLTAYCNQIHWPARAKAEFFAKVMEHRNKLLERNDYEISVKESLGFVEYLLSECYADVVMISLLGLTLEQYLNLFSADYAKAVSAYHANEDPTDYVTLMERTGLVVYEMSGNTDFIGRDHTNRPAQSQMYRDIHKFSKTLNNEIRIWSDLPRPQGAPVDSILCYHPFEVMDIISVYLNECHIYMDRLDKEFAENDPDDTLNSLRKSFNLYAKENRIAGAKFFLEIANYRNEIFGE